MLKIFREILRIKHHCKDNNHYEVIYNDHKLNGEVGKLVSAPGFSINIEEIDASKDAEFTVTYVSKLQAITDLQNSFSVVDQGKDTGMLTLSLAGSNDELIKILSIVLVKII